MKKLLVVLMTAVFIAGMGIGYAAEMKIGYVDFEKVFNEYNRTKTEDASLKSKLEKKEKELEKKSVEISKMRDDSELLSEDARKKKEDEIKEKIKELGQLRKEAQDKLLEERNEKWLEIYDEIKKVISDYAKKNDFMFIMDDKALVYKIEKDDITDEVVKILNKK